MASSSGSGSGFATAHRLKALPPYLFVELDRLKREAQAAGKDVIDLGIGDPDLPTPEPIVAQLADRARIAANHRYPSGAGCPAFRKAVARYYADIHGVTLDPETEVTALIGSKEGLGHFPLAFVDPGDIVLIPDPGYPVYRSAVVFAGGEPLAMPLRESHGFLPDLDAISADVLSRTRLMVLNYPNNPTGALAPREFFERVVSLARRHGFIVLHDAAYLDMVHGDAEQPSFLSIPGAREVGVELHSLSKTFHMTGWRIAFAAGHPDLIRGLRAIKANLDSGVFGAIQDAATFALDHFKDLTPPLKAIYRERAIALSKGLAAANWPLAVPLDATFYAWLPVRGGLDSATMARRLIEECAVVGIPGTGFGACGEGYIRLAMTAPASRLSEALHRFRQAGI